MFLIFGVYSFSVNVEFVPFIFYSVTSLNFIPLSFCNGNKSKSEGSNSQNKKFGFKNRILISNKHVPVVFCFSLLHVLVDFPKLQESVEFT